MERKPFVLRPTFSFAMLKNSKYAFFILAILAAAQYVPVPFLSMAAIIPFLIAVYKFIYWHMVKYEVTPEQIKYSRGVFSYKVDYLEIYRIKDYEVNQPFLMRIFSIMHLTVCTSDNSHPYFTFEGIEKSDFPEALRGIVERARRDKRVYENTEYIS